MFFVDRRDAGRQLADRLGHLKGAEVVVSGLPRAGVSVAAEVADALGAPLDVCLVRKRGVPLQPESGTGAIGKGGVRVIGTGATARAACQIARARGAARIVLAVPVASHD